MQCEFCGNTATIKAIRDEAGNGVGGHLVCDDHANRFPQANGWRHERVVAPTYGARRELDADEARQYLKRALDTVTGRAVLDAMGFRGIDPDQATDEDAIHVATSVKRELRRLYHL